MEGIGVQGPKKVVLAYNPKQALQANFEYAYTLCAGTAGKVGKSYFCKILPTPQVWAVPALLANFGWVKYCLYSGCGQCRHCRQT